MEVKIITGTAEEIAALVAATQGRREGTFNGHRNPPNIQERMENAFAAVLEKRKVLGMSKTSPKTKGRRERKSGDYPAKRKKRIKTRPGGKPSEKSRMREVL